jgi:MoaA/NifB/PqqE/SkfB family radical SAM enzyme
MVNALESNTQLPLRPRNLYLVLTTACNLRCKQCFLWDLPRPPDALNPEERLKAVADFARLSPGGRVILTGGEPFLQREHLFDILAVCREHGLRVEINTNGTLLYGEVVARLLRCPPDRLVVSLDSHRPEVHDGPRGKRGTFEEVVQNVRELARARSPERHVSVFIHAFVFEGNIYALEEFVEFVRSLAVDGVQFQLLGPSFALRAREDLFFKSESCRDPLRAAAALVALAERYRDDPFVVTRPREFMLIADHLRGGVESRPGVCRSHEKNIVLDMKGDVQLCFSMRALTGGRAVGNVRESSLEALWSSPFAGSMRALMGRCGKACGLLSCHRRDEEPLRTE